MIRPDLLIAGIYAIGWGGVLVAYAPAVQRLASRFPKPLRYILFDIYRLDPLGPEMYLRCRIVGASFLVLGCVLVAFVVFANLFAHKIEVP